MTHGEFEQLTKDDKVTINMPGGGGGCLLDGYEYEVVGKTVTRAGKPRVCVRCSGGCLSEVVDHTTGKIIYGCIWHMEYLNAIKQITEEDVRKATPLDLSIIGKISEEINFNFKVS